MATALRSKCSLDFLFFVALAFVLCPLTANSQQLTVAQIKALPECLLPKTNNSCKIIIDRANPVAPPTIQMYSNQALTVIVKNPKTYERYFLDYQSGQAALSPDIATSIVQGLLPSLAKAEVIHTENLVRTQDNCAILLTQGTPTAPVTVPENCDVTAFAADYEARLASFAREAIGIYRELEPFVSPDSHLPTSSGVKDLGTIQTEINSVLPHEFGLSGAIAVISANLKVPFPGQAQELTAYQGIADAVAKDLLGYSQRITDLGNFNNASQECDNVAKEQRQGIQCVVITSNSDDEQIYHNMVTRMIAYGLNALNLVSNIQEAAPDPTKKKLLASISINFADSSSKPSSLRWEASAGVFFSSLAVRSFTVAPVFTSGAITNNIITQNILHPTVVPFAAGNYRISNDLRWTRWKSAIYWTGAVGVNPNTVSADFASGLSISWRGLMFSPLWHYGHDVRLTQGLYVGKSLGAGFKGSVTTQSYWTSSFALGLGIRVPSLTGR